MAAINSAEYAGTVIAAKILSIDNLVDIIWFMIKGDHERTNHTRMKGPHLMLRQVGIATFDIPSDETIQTKDRLTEILV